MRQVSRPADPTPLFRHGSDATRQRQPLLDFSVNLNPLGPPPSVQEALRRELDGIGRYPDPECRLLKLELALRHGLSPAQIVVGNGSNELIHAIVQRLPMRLEVIVEPTYTEYLRASLGVDHKVEHWLSEAASFSPEPFTLPAARRIWLCNPNNPTGQLWRRDQLAPWIAANPTADFVVDEAFLPFRSDEQIYSLVNDVHWLPNLVVLRSLTKVYTLPGLRLGYLVTQPGLAAKIQNQLPTWSVNIQAQAAGLAALRDQVFLTRTHTWLNTERPEFLMKLSALPGLDPVPSQANFFLLRLREDWAGSVADRLAERGIAVRDASNFVGLDHHYIRVAVRTRAENQRLVDELGTLLRGG
jgi:threonine-phosphate decarboxylase